MGSPGHAHGEWGIPGQAPAPRVMVRPITRRAPCHLGWSLWTGPWQRELSLHQHPDRGLGRHTIWEPLTPRWVALPARGRAPPRDFLLA